MFCTGVKYWPKYWSENVKKLVKNNCFFDMLGIGILSEPHFLNNLLEVVIIQRTIGVPKHLTEQPLSI